MVDLDLVDIVYQLISKQGDAVKSLVAPKVEEGVEEEGMKVWIESQINLLVSFD